MHEMRFNSGINNFNLDLHVLFKEGNLKFCLKLVLLNKYSFIYFDVCLHE